MVKSRAQECHYHVIIGEIARERKVSRELTKRVMIVKFKHECQHDARLRELWVGVSDETRQFPKDLACAFVDFLYSWQAANVVQESRAPDA